MVHCGDSVASSYLPQTPMSSIDLGQSVLRGENPVGGRIEAHKPLCRSGSETPSDNPLPAVEEVSSRPRDLRRPCPPSFPVGPQPPPAPTLGHVTPARPQTHRPGFADHDPAQCATPTPRKPLATLPRYPRTSRPTIQPKSLRQSAPPHGPRACPPSPRLPGLAARTSIGHWVSTATPGSPPLCGCSVLSAFS